MSTLFDVLISRGGVIRAERPLNGLFSCFCRSFCLFSAPSRASSPPGTPEAPNITSITFINVWCTFYWIWISFLTFLACLLSFWRVFDRPRPILSHRPQTQAPAHANGDVTTFPQPYCALEYVYRLQTAKPAGSKLFLAVCACG